MTRRDIEGKVALVTGGGTGIGRGIALALAENGVKVALMGRRESPLEQTAGEIASTGGTAHVVPGDVSLEKDVRRAVDATENALGTVDILVNNAGIGGGSAIHEHTVEAWDKIMSVNLRGPFLMARAVLPGMRRRREGHIINISSESGLEYYPGNGAYGVSKHALNVLAELIQRENQDHGIRVDTICPGMVVTEMSENRPGLDHEKCLYPPDVAELVLWLLTRRPNVKIGRPLLIQTMANPWA